MNMDFGANEASVEVIKEETFGGIFFRDIYSGVNGKQYNENGFSKSWEEFDELKNIDKNMSLKLLQILTKILLLKLL